MVCWDVRTNVACFIDVCFKLIFFACVLCLLVFALFICEHSRAPRVIWDFVWML